MVRVSFDTNAVIPCASNLAKSAASGVISRGKSTLHFGVQIAEAVPFKRFFQLAATGVIPLLAYEQLQRGRDWSAYASKIEGDIEQAAIGFGRYRPHELALAKTEIVAARAQARSEYFGAALKLVLIAAIGVAFLTPYMPAHAFLSAEYILPTGFGSEVVKLSVHVGVNTAITVGAKVLAAMNIAHVAWNVDTSSSATDDRGYETGLEQVDK